MWMYALLPQILNMSFTAGIVIILVLFARLLLKKAPKIFSYVLWAVVLFRLICPVSVSSQFSLFALFHVPASTTNGSTYSVIHYIPTNIMDAESAQADWGTTGTVDDTVPQGEGQTATDTLDAQRKGRIAAATFLWLAGIAAMLIYSVISFVRLRGKLIGAVRLRGNIYLADHIASPFVIGVVCPKIYLPSTLPEEEQSYVILHELTHIRRCDHIIKMLAFLALAVHWFNPLVWLAFVCAVKDMEMSCDEYVLKQMGGEIKGAYGASLLSLATGRRLINGGPLAFGEGDIKGRITNVMNFKKPAAWIIAVAVMLVVALSIGLAANGVIDRADPDGYRALFKEQFTEARKVGLYYTALSCMDSDAKPAFSEGNAEYYRCKHYHSKAELQSATAAIFTGEEAQGFNTLLHSNAYLERDAGLYIAPSLLLDASVWQAEDTISFQGQTIDTFLWDSLTVVKAEDSTVSYTLDWYDTYPGDPITSAFTLIKGADGVWRFDECFADAEKAAKANTAEPLIFTSDQTDPITLGTLAFNIYMDYRVSEKTPVEERIASYRLNDISVLAGDSNEFCAAIHYDITTDSDSYLNPALGAQGKGTWTDNYMEIRVKYAYDNLYSIKGVGTGGGAQGLAPYVAGPSSTENLSTGAAERAQAVLDSVISDGTVAMTLNTVDGVGGGRYEVQSEDGDGPNRVTGFNSSFNWSYAESGHTFASKSESTLKVESPDGTAAISMFI